ncbi:MAG TPA: hypothetical protein VNF51_02735 [Candidatus Paceibacterota bacterium]|nr:hypothetical protein [Candidatus Paceibacterota bacterium]
MDFIFLQNLPQELRIRRIRLIASGALILIVLWLWVSWRFGFPPFVTRSPIPQTQQTVLDSLSAPNTVHISQDVLNSLTAPSTIIGTVQKNSTSTSPKK